MKQAKEKAEELVEKMTDKYYKSQAIVAINKEQVKRCAIIAADEILSIVYLDHQVEYWENVKSEIEKL